MLDLAFYVNLGVGCLLFILAFIMMRIAPRDRRAVTFSIFLLLVAINFTANYFAAATKFVLGDTPGQRTWLAVGEAVLVLDPLVLIYFAALYPRRRGPARGWWGPSVLALVGVGLSAWMVYDYYTIPRAFSLRYKAAQEIELYIAYLGVLWVMTRTWVLEKDPAQRTPHGLLVVGLAAMVLPRTAIVAQSLSEADFRNAMTVADAMMIVAVHAVLFLVLPAVMPGPLGRRQGGGRVPASGRQKAWGLARHDLALVIVGFAVPLLLTLFWSRLLAFSGGNPALLFSSRWIIFAIVAGYALLKTRLVDLDLRLAGGATVAIIAGSALLAYFSTEALAEWLRPQWNRSFVVALGIFAGVLVSPFAWMVARRGRDRLVPSDEVAREAYLARRRLEVYGAAISYAVAEGREVGDDPTVRRLRRELSIGIRDHRRIVALAESEMRLGNQPFAAFRMGAVVGRRYVVAEQIGGGRHGRTYRATDQETRDIVVLKELRPEWAGLPSIRQRFELEAEILQNIRHPHVVEGRDLFEANQSLCLVLEYLEGGDLRHRIDKSGGALPVAEARRIALEILAGLGALHAEGVVHRDVKPANVLFDARGRAKIADLGIAMEGAAPGGAASPAGGVGMAELEMTVVTGAEGQPGTVAYMAPEQAKGSDVDARTDLYAVGVVLYEMLVGRPAVDVRHLSDYEARTKVIEVGPDLHLPSDLRAWRTVLRKATAQDRAKRFRDAASFRAAIEAVEA